MTERDSNRVVCEFAQTLAAAPEQVFPLLCPVREADYLPGWKYRLVYSRSGLAEPGCIFASPNDDGTETTWIMTAHQPSEHVAFAWVHPKKIAARLRFTLRPEGRGSTALHARYEYTALSEEGRVQMEAFTDAWFAGRMKRFGGALGYYIKHGRMIEE